MIIVKSARPGFVAFWERHPDHPGGEAFVANRPVEVAETPAVKAALVNGRLMESLPAINPDLQTFAGEQIADVDATDAARDLAAELGIDLWTVTGTLKNGRIGVDDVRSAADG